MPFPILPRGRQRCSSVAVGAALAVLASPARGDLPPFGAVPRAPGPIEVDGRLDDAAWADALAVPLPYEVYPGDNAPAPVETTVLLLRDDENLYLAFRALDPDPSRVRYHYTDRDGAFRNDLVGVVLDPFLDRRRGFLFAVNPVGVQMDARAQQEGDAGDGNVFFNVSGAPLEDGSWDELWFSAGVRNAEGYTVEIVIPFRSLRYPRGGGAQTWGFLAFRQYPRDQRYRFRSSPLDRDDSCWLCQLGTIELEEAPRPGLALELLPTLTGLSIEERAEDDPEQPLETTESAAELGLSARWGFTPNSSLNLALNPDFSQVEADAPQLAINNRFALYYPERRPLFLEGADLFETPIDVVYTRSIVDPSAVAKVTLREGSNGLGAFVARDEPTLLILPFPGGSIPAGFDRRNTTGVVRYRRDFGRGSSIGAIATTRQGDAYHNTVAGLDGVLRVSPTDVVTWQWLHSDTRYPDAFAEEFRQPEETFEGAAWTLGYDHEARDWSWYASAGARSPGFRADAGYIPRVDERAGYAALARTFYGPAGGWWTRLNLYAEGSRDENGDGDLLDQSLALGLEYSGPYQFSFTLRPALDKEAFQGTVYDLAGVRTFFNIRPTGDFTCSLGMRYGDAIDYANARRGRRLRIQPGLTWNIGSHFYVQLDHEYEAFDDPTGRLYTANLTNLRLVHQFGLRTFVRLIAQQVAIDRDPALYDVGDGEEPVAASSRRLFGQFLFAYKATPRTVFYAGFDGRSLATDAEERFVAGRKAFIKLGYEWRP